MAAYEDVQAALEESRRDVAVASVPSTDDQAAIERAWQRAWETLTRQVTLYAPGAFVTEREIVQALAADGDAAMLFALHALLSLWCAAEDGYDATGERARTRCAALLDVADEMARSRVYGGALEEARAIENALRGQVAAVEQALREIESALAVARLAAQHA